MFDPRLLGNDRGARQHDSRLSSANNPGDENDESITGATTRRPLRVSLSNYERHTKEMQIYPTGVHLKSATYDDADDDGTIAWQDYHSHFEWVC